MKNEQVYLIGTRLGSLELLTLGAVRSIRLADVILIGSLVNPDVLEFAQGNAQIVYVGKRGGCHSTPQTLIHKQMVSLACAGKVVVRIKGGDSIMFGRGWEEVQTLRQDGISVSVVSGITAELSIPLAYRDCTHGLKIVTGHTQETKETNWQALAAIRITLDIYMSMSNLGYIVQQLIAHGLSKDIFAAAIQNGTLLNQQQVLATLGLIESLVATEKMANPAIAVNGEVVRFSIDAEQVSQRFAA